MPFERVDAEEVWKGRIVSVRTEHWRHEDGEVVEREMVAHPGAVAVVAHDGDRLYLVRQPREAVGEPSLLEVPAGKLDEEGEDALATAKRELIEEIGKSAATWEHLTTFYASPGFSDEQIWIYLATDLTDAHAETDENERIEIETVPLGQIDDVIRNCEDSKSLIGLLWFRAFSMEAA